MKHWGVAFFLALLLHAGVLWGLSRWDHTPPRMSMRSGVTSVEISFQTKKRPEPKTVVEPEEKTKEIKKKSKPPKKPEPQDKAKPKPQPREESEKPSSREPKNPGETRREETVEQTKTERPPQSTPDTVPTPPKEEITKNPEPSTEKSSVEPDTNPKPEKKKKKIVEKKAPEPNQEKSSEPKKRDKSEPTEESPPTTETSEEENLRESARSEGATWVEDPNYVSNPAPTYPYQARIRGIEGRVMLLVEINPQGNPTRVDIHESSGSYLLDEAAMKAVRDWRFKPAVENGNPVPAQTLVPIRFTLDR